MGITEGDRGLESLTTVFICRNVIPVLPTEEKFCMASQLRRSAQSIPANIAEGYGRFYFQENVRFCYISRGSIDETRSHLMLAYSLGYIQPELYNNARNHLDEIRRMLNGYIAYLKKSRPGVNEPGAQIGEGKEVYSIECVKHDSPSELINSSLIDLSPIDY